MLIWALVLILLLFISSYTTRNNSHGNDWRPTYHVFSEIGVCTHVLLCENDCVLLNSLGKSEVSYFFAMRVKILFQSEKVLDVHSEVVDRHNMCWFHLSLPKKLPIFLVTNFQVFLDKVPCSNLFFWNYIRSHWKCIRQL